MKNKFRSLQTILLFMAPSILIGMIVGAFPGYQFFRFTWYDAEFCTSCHLHDYANVAWANSAHGELTTCHDCHHQRLRDYIRETIVLIKDRPKFPEDLHHTPYVKQEICAACHVSNAADRSTITGPFTFEDVEKIPKVDLSYLHSAHLKKDTEFVLMNHEKIPLNERDSENLYPTLEPNRQKAEKRAITCADCHGGPQNRGHNFAAVDNSCVRCHEDQHKSKVTQNFGCRSCHFQDFMIPIDKKKPSMDPSFETNSRDKSKPKQQ